MDIKDVYKEKKTTGISNNAYAYVGTDEEIKKRWHEKLLY